MRGTDVSQGLALDSFPRNKRHAFMAGKCKLLPEKALIIPAAELEMSKRGPTTGKRGVNRRAITVRGRSASERRVTVPWKTSL